MGPFRRAWGRPLTLKVDVEEYDQFDPNDHAIGEKSDDTFVLLWANREFVTRCKNDAEVTVRLECPEVAIPRLPAYPE